MNPSHHWGDLQSSSTNPWACLDSGQGSMTATALPRITVITPSFNQAQYLEATIRSVLSQGYPNLEYFVIDGGSTDGSREVIERYAPWIDYWVSEPDQGQTDAILKGLQKATGEWFNWINSDDLLAPGALWQIARVAMSTPDIDAIAGNVQNFRGSHFEDLLKPTRLDAEQLIFEPLSGTVFHQPGIWVRRHAALGLGMNRQFGYRFDFDFYIRYLHHHPRLHVTDVLLAYFRFHGTSKSVSQWQRFYNERLDVLGLLSTDASLAPSLRQTANLALRRWRWFDVLDEIVEDRKHSRLYRIMQILRQIGEDREARWVWQTFKALRRITFKGGRAPNRNFLGGRFS